MTTSLLFLTSLSIVRRVLTAKVYFLGARFGLLA